MTAHWIIRLWGALLIVLTLQTTAWCGPSLLVDFATGKVIQQDRAGDPWYPASLTKLMTAYLSFAELRAGKLKLDQQIPISKLAQSMPPTKIGMKAGQTISVDLALQALAVHSANDMAVALAEAGAGDVDRFVGRMNEAARRLGMTGTHFANPHGLFDPAQRSTARDLAVLAIAILREYPEFQHYFSQKYMKIGRIKLRNHNNLLKVMEEADGMKTGFVCNSGFNLVATAEKNGRRLVNVVLGADNPEGRATWAKDMLTEGFAAPAAGPELASLANRANAQPADMKQEVCKGRSGVKLVPARQLKGHGVLLGRYHSRSDAQRALQAREAAIGAGDKGIVMLSRQMGYGVFVWNLDMAGARERCETLRKAGAYCEAFDPDSLAKVAAAAPHEAAAGAKKRRR